VQITVVGTGYVGLVAGACFAETGNDVTCVDLDTAKVDALRAGRIPIYEPGLEDLVQRNTAAGRLHFTTDTARAVAHARVIFLAVGTPPGEDGSADLSHVLAAARTVGLALAEDAIVVTKSTVPVGTGALVRAAIGAVTVRRFHVCSNPEFLKEGAAIEDFMKPDRVVLGVESQAAADVLRDLYAPFVRTGKPVLVMSIPSAEAVKYAANAMLATRISFINEVARFCEAAGADVDDVRRGIGSDARIGPSFLFPGPGYGGSCFPKDVQALLRSAATLGVPLQVVAAVEEANTVQKQLLGTRVVARFGPSLEGRTIAVWGLAFKANTDDMRESPAIPTVDILMAHGARVRAHDPKAMPEALRLFARWRDAFSVVPSAYEALEGADALVIVTDWPEYRHPDFARMALALGPTPVIIDGRNLYSPNAMAAVGFEYHSFGRACVPPQAAR
jgi:UDPglucose 6-dehydrogenase